MKTESYTATIEVAKSPQDVFNHITNDVSKWWGGKDLEGSSKKLNDEFTICHPGTHYSKQKLVELIPDKKVVWLVTEGTLNWLKGDMNEWTNTKMVFEISAKDDKTVLHFTHEGLVPEKECYALCSQGWDMVIKDWLFHFIMEGKIKINQMQNENFHITVTVNASAEEAMKKISQVNLWWAKNFKGKAEKRGDTFTVRFGETFVDFKISELVPNKKVAWKVTDCNLHWVNNKKEWNDTDVVFEISGKGNTTQIDFTHIGLVPDVECYKDCEVGWTGHVTSSLVKLINEGKGMPE